MYLLIYTFMNDIYTVEVCYIQTLFLLIFFSNLRLLLNKSDQNKPEISKCPPVSADPIS